MGEDKNSINKVEVLFNISYDTLLVDLVLLNTTNVGQPRCVEDTDLRKKLWPPHCAKNPRSYQYPIGARNFVKVGRPNLLISTSSFWYAVENIEVVMIDVVAKKDIGNQFQECRLSGVGPSNKNDSV